MKPIYWSLVVKRGEELMRTPFRYGQRVHPVVTQIARERGWTPVAYVGVAKHNLPSSQIEWRLVTV